MYGRSRPVRPCASWTVATPRSPNNRTVSASGRRMLRTPLWLIGNLLLLNQCARIGDRHARDLFRREPDFKQVLGEHGETFGDRRDHGMDEMRPKTAALRTHLPYVVHHHTPSRRR